MKKERKNKGITLIALIITIIVMLILVGVSVNVALNGGLFDTAKQAVQEQEKAQEKENLIGYSVNYYQLTGIGLSDETIETMAQTIIETEISSDKLTVHHNPKDGTQYVLYRIDKTSEEEREILEAKGIKALRGDVTLDGILTQEDADIIADYEVSYPEDFPEIKIEIGDLDNDGGLTSSDTYFIEEMLGGGFNYEGGYIE